MSHAPSRRFLLLSIAVVLAGGAVVGCGGSRVRSGMGTATLVQLLESPRHQERRRAADMLGVARDPAATQPLMNVLARERYTHVVAAVLYALAYIGAPEAYPVIQGHLTHANAKVVRAAGRPQKLYDRYRAHYGQPLPVVHGRTVLPAAPGAPPPPEAPPPEPAEEE
ncbi:MAG: HEAT repeat domain-containing protein [Deltaproteobacteria bacterium]|nr:HEAT repeat domain-containing protein [Deltaproteobacteria bacterium]